MSRKSLSLIALMAIVASLSVVPSSANHCSYQRNQIWISSGVAIPGFEDGGAGTGPTGSVTGRTTFGGYGCTLEQGVRVTDDETTVVGEIKTPGIISNVNTQYFTPGATHWQVRAVMNYPYCKLCTKPGEGPTGYQYSHYDVDTGSGFGTDRLITWTFDVNENHWRSAAMTLASNVKRIRITISVTDAEQPNNVEKWVNVSRIYAKCNSQPAPAPANRVCIPPQ